MTTHIAGQAAQQSVVSKVGMALRAVRRFPDEAQYSRTDFPSESTDGSESHPYLVWNACEVMLSHR